MPAPFPATRCGNWCCTSCAWAHRLWRACSLGGLRTPRPCGTAATPGLQMQTTRKDWLSASGSRAHGGTNGHLPGVRALPHLGCHFGRIGIRVAIVLHGGGTRVGLHRVRWPDLDASRLLRCGCRRRGIIAISAHKLTLKSVGKDKLLWVIFLVLAAVTVITESEIAWLFWPASIVTWLWRAPPKRWRGGGLAGFAPIELAHTSGILTTLDWPLLRHR